MVKHKLINIKINPTVWKKLQRKGLLLNWRCSETVGTGQPFRQLCWQSQSTRVLQEREQEDGKEEEDKM